MECVLERYLGLSFVYICYLNERQTILLFYPGKILIMLVQMHLQKDVVYIFILLEDSFYFPPVS